MRALAGLAATMVLLSACGSGEPTSADAAGTDAAPAEAPATHPDIVAAEAEHQGDDRWRFDVTVSSPYDSADRYADAWRVLGPDGGVLGVR